MQKLLGLLADGELHSGSELAASLEITRAAVWKQIQQLEELGVAVTRLPGKGYQLQARTEMLDAREISAAAFVAGPLYEMEQESGSIIKHAMKQSMKFEKKEEESV